MLINSLKCKNNETKSKLQLIIYLLLFYLIVLFCFLIGWFVYNFPSKGVSGPGNEFIPIIRTFLLIFIIIYPSLGFFTTVGLFSNRKETNFLLVIDHLKPEIKFHLLWFLIWPGLFFIYGFFYDLITPIFDTSLPNSLYWNYYWIIFFLLGRMIDIRQFFKLKDKYYLQLKIKNKLLIYVIFILIDLLIIYIASLFQFITFFLGFW